MKSSMRLPSALLFFCFVLFLSPGLSAHDTGAVVDDPVLRSVNGQQVRLLSSTAAVEYWADVQGHRTRLRKSPIISDLTGEGMINPTGDIDNSGRCDTEERDPVWTTNGPFAADINDILISQGDPDIIYAAVGGGGHFYLGGLYRSEDSGADWSRIDPGNESFGEVYHLSQRPDDPDVIFAAAEFGLFRSNDGGNTWEELHPAVANGGSRVVAVNPDNGDDLLVHYSSAEPVGLYRSLDGGDSFTPVTSGLPSSPSITDIEYEPRNSENVYLSIGGDFGNHGFYVSRNGGDRWSSDEDGLDEMPVNQVICHYGASSTQLFVATGRSFAGQYGGLFRKLLPGGEWIPVNDGYFQGKVARCLAISQHDEQLLLVGTDEHGIVRSTDQGQSWNSVSLGLISSTVTSIEFHPLDQSSAYAGSEGIGFFTSDDTGQNWVSSSSGMAMVNVTDVAIHPNDPLRIAVSFTSMNSGGIFITEDGGNQWLAASNLVNQRARSVDFHPADDQIIFAALEGPVSETTPEGIYRSDDGGQNWATNGPNETGYLDNMIYTVAVKPDNPSVILAGARYYGPGTYSRIFRSVDGGGSWGLVNQGTNYSFLMDFSFYPPDPSVVFAAEEFTGAGSGQGGVLKSVDGGVTWTSLGDVIPGGAMDCRSVSVAPDSDQVIYAALISNGIYKTTDGGSTWSQTNFPAGSASCVAVHPYDRDHVLASSGSVPISRTKDGGALIYDLYEGFPELSAYRFGFDRDVDDLKAYACGSQGLYFISLGQVAVPDTCDLGLTCTPPVFVLPETVGLDVQVENILSHNRTFDLSIDLKLPGNLVYTPYRHGILNLDGGAIFTASYPINFPAYGSLVGITEFRLTGEDITLANIDSGIPAGHIEAVQCQVEATAP